MNEAQKREAMEGLPNPIPFLHLCPSLPAQALLSGVDWSVRL